MKKKPTAKKLQKYQNSGSVDNPPIYSNPFSGFMGNYDAVPTGTPIFDLSSIFGGSDLYKNVMNVGQQISTSGFGQIKPKSYEEFLKHYGYNDDFLSKTKYQAYQMAEGSVNKNNQDLLNKNAPLIANITAMDELGKMTEKSYNQGLKLDAQDLTKGTKGQEFRGFFAKDGGSINTLHRSMGADVGLPIQKKQSGGQINQLQQILGYKDGSPFAKLPFQTINSNSITMDGVSQPLLAIADNGNVKLMPPNSGLHKFKGAKSVTEIPLGNYEEGGIPDRYKEMGFTKVGQKKESNRDGKKWMVLAKKGDQYKVVHGGADGMEDFSQHKDEDRKERFWDRMGCRDSAKANDPFSPLYYHKKFGTW